MKSTFEGISIFRININFTFTEIGLKATDWINRVQDRDRLRTLVSTVIKL
jgi:hypothetical protein